MIDLHVHTTMSDGTLSPEEVVRHARDRGIEAIAVTDHDTTAGIAPARIQGVKSDLEVIPGVEISSQWPDGIMHVLGYLIRPDDPDLLACLAWLSNGRRERIPLILAKLHDNGVRISEQEVAEEAIGGVPGRPHVANVLVRKGYVRTLQDAFDRYLKKGAPAYVVKTKLEPEKAIQAIAKAGGLPVLAHPYSLNEQDSDKLSEIVTKLMAYGLRGIEAYYSKHTREQTDVYLAIASRLGLIVTGGSDFHGANKPDVEMGVVPAAGCLPYRLVEDLKSASEPCRLAANAASTHDVMTSNGTIHS